jgi:hypothetical protein
MVVEAVEALVPQDQLVVHLLQKVVQVVLEKHIQSQMVLLQFTTLVVVVVEHTVVDKVVVEDKVVVVKEINYLKLNQVQHKEVLQETLV